MGTATHVTTADGETVSADAVYEQCIVSNNRICNNCFQRIKLIQPAPDADYWAEHGIRTSNGHSTASLRTVVHDITLGPTADGEVAYPGAVVNTSGRIVAGGTNSGVVACGECGQLNGRADTDARSVGEMVTATERVATRLAEQDVAVDRDVLFDRVRELKRTPDDAAKDFAIFEQAVSAAVTAALEAHDDPQSRLRPDH